MIADQRDIEAGSTGATFEDVRRSWLAYTGRPNFTGFRMRYGERNWIQTEEHVQAYISDNRWVADCPYEYCNAGMMVSPGHEYCACYDCGHIYLVDFPEDLKTAVEVLEARSVLSSRNWNPRTEKVSDLKAENKKRGLPLKRVVVQSKPAPLPSVFHTPQVPGPDLPLPEEAKA